MFTIEDGLFCVLALYLRPGGYGGNRKKYKRRNEDHIFMSSKFKRSALGARVPHEKKTSGMATVAMPLPEKIVLPMQQHIGARAPPR